MRRVAYLRLAAALAGSALAGACFLDDLLSPKSPQDITIEVDDAAMVVGDTVQLVARALANGQAFPSRFGFSSTRPLVATVDDAGRVTVLLRDTFSIVVALRSGNLVGDPPDTSASFRGLAARVVASVDTLLNSIGAKAQLSATAQDKQANTIPGVKLSWLSENPALVTVDSTGLVEARGNTGPPRVRVIVSADGRADTVRVGVRQLTRTLVISPSALALNGVGETAQLTADARDSLGAVNLATTTQWSTTSSQVVTVSAAGVATAAGEGIAGVVATSDQAKDTARVVVNRLLDQLIVTPEQATFPALRSQLNLLARGVDQAGDTVAVPGIEWRALDPAIATVDTAGVVTSVSNGVARIVGAAGGREDTVTVTVDQVLASVAIVQPAGDTTFTSLQDAARFVAQGHDANGERIPLERCCVFTFATDNAGVATVDAEGLVTARGNGSATISATTAGLVGSRVVNVSQQVWTVDVQPGRLSVVQNQRAQLSAAAYDRRGNRIRFSGFNWTSRNGGVASPLGSTVDTVTIQGGNVNDSTYVLASSGGRTDSALVRVGPLASLCVGGTPHSGTVNVSQTWTRAGSPHCVGGGVLIQAATVTIEAGATVKFAASATLDVGLCCNPGQSGRIRANGTPALPILFTALDPDPRRGTWGGIRTHWVAPNDSLIFRNVVMEYGGGGLALTDVPPGELRYGSIGHANTCQGTILLDAVTIRDSHVYGVATPCALTITNTVITRAFGAGVVSTGGTTRVTGSRITMSGWGLDVTNAATLVDVSGTRVTENAGRAVVTNVASLNALQDLPADSLLGNASDVIEVVGSGNLTTRDLFIDRRVPWRFQGANIGIGGGRTLTIDAGTTIKLSGGQLCIGCSHDVLNTIGTGRIIANGQNGEIRFTSGQSNPQPGDWGFISLRQLSDTSVLRNVVLEYGGPCCNGGHILSENTGAPILLDRVTSRRSRLQGIKVTGPLVVQGPIYADSNATEGMELHARDVTIANSRFIGNGSHGLVAWASARRLALNSSEFALNGGHGAQVSGDTLAVNGSIFRNNGQQGLQFASDPGGSPPGNRPEIRNSTVQNNGGDGLSVHPSGNAVIEYNLIQDNGGAGLNVANADRVQSNLIRRNRYPAQLTSNVLGAMARQSIDSLLGNTNDTLVVTCCGDVSFATDTIRTRASLPWRTDASLNFRGGVIWKVEPGARVTFNAGGANVGVDDATILARGTAANPILFTGSTNNPGAWGYVDFQARRDTSVLRHVVIRNGGNGSSFSLRVAGAPSNPVILDSVRVVRAQGNGIHIDDEARLTGVVVDSSGGRGLQIQPRDITVTDSRFAYNGSEGIWSSVNARKLTLRRATIYRNNGNGAQLNGDSTTVDSSTVRRNGGAGLVLCCDGNNPLRPAVLRSVVDTNSQGGVSMAGAQGGLVQDNQIVKNGGVGLTQHNGGVVSGNRIQGNRLPLAVNAAGLSAITGQSIDDLLGNTGDTLVVECCSGEEVIATDTIRTKAVLPWRVDVGLRFVNRTVWKLEAGAQVFLNGGRIQIGQNPPCTPATQGAVLLAESDDTAPIRFTSRNPTRGAWQQILLECLSGTTKLRNVEVRYAGSGGQDAVRIAPGTAGVSVVFDSVRVRQSQGTAINVENGSNVTFLRYLAADSNNADGLLIGAPSRSIPAGSFTGNVEDGIEVAADDVTLTNVASRGNGRHGILLHNGAAYIANSTFAKNGSNGIQVNGGGSDTIITSRADSNAQHGMEMVTGPVSFTNNTLRGNGGSGIFSSSGSALFFSAFSGNTITGNGGYGVVLDGASLGAFAAQDQSTLLGNGRDTLCICSGPNDARMTAGSPTVRAILPWKNQVSLTVGGDRTLNLEPGARLIMDNGAAVFVGRGDGSARGNLRALGTAANPIRILARDTTVRGFWHQLAIENQHDSSILKHVELVGGGSSGSFQTLYAGDLNGLVVRLDTVTVRKSSRHGVWFGGGPFRINALRALDNDSAGVVLTGGTVTLNNSRLENNGFTGIRVDGGGGHVIGGSLGSIIAGNGTWGVRNLTADLVTATMNWWGAACGPVHASNACAGTNAVTDNVSFTNPLGAPPGIP